MSPNINAIEFV
jgi:hypothetical protein